MASVTIHAGRGEGVASGCRLPVKRSSVLLAFGGVADGAVHGGHVRRRVGKGKVPVAGRASDAGGSVHGGGQILRGHQELVRTIHPLHHGGIPVAHETHLVVHLCAERSLGDGKSHQEEDNSSRDCSILHDSAEKP
jgi:hypothetical protein